MTVGETLWLDGRQTKEGHVQGERRRPHTILLMVCVCVGVCCRKSIQTERVVVHIRERLGLYFEFGADSE